MKLRFENECFKKRDSVSKRIVQNSLIQFQNSGTSVLVLLGDFSLELCITFYEYIENKVHICEK